MYEGESDVDTDMDGAVQCAVQYIVVYDSADRLMQWSTIQGVAIQ